MFLKRHRARIARSIVGVIAAGFIQVGFSAPAAVAAPLAAPTISSVTTTATSLTVNMQTSGMAATSWRYSLTRRQVSGCATSVTDGAVLSTVSLQSSITITGLTEGCYYTVKVAGFNGAIGSYATVEKLVNGYFNGLKGYHINENTTYEGFTRVPFTSGTCSTESITSVYKEWSGGGPAGCNTDHFTSYFVGYLRAPVTGAVTFRSTNDDGMQLNIQGQNVLFGALSNSAPSGSINMVQDEIYRIEIWFHEYLGGASFFLDWEYTGRTRIQIPSANLASDPSLFFGTCPLGLDARCSAGSALEIKLATGTNMDGMYWIDVNGVPTLTYSIMNSAMSGGGWMLAMKGAKTNQALEYANALWTNTTLHNATYPQRWKADDTIRNIDAKYGVYVHNRMNQIMVLYPEQTTYAGGAIAAGTTGNTSTPYGFSWIETTTAGRPWTSSDGDSWDDDNTNVGGPNKTNCVNVASTLTNLFATANRCAFRTVNHLYSASETPYSAIGQDLFYSQINIKFFGINYGNRNGVALARLGFGWNENGATDEGSNDGSGGIGLKYGSFNVYSGSINNCCADANATPPRGQYGISGSSNGSSRAMPFELFIRNSSAATISGRNLRVTANRANSLVAGSGYSTSGTNGSNTFRLSPVREGFTIDSSNGVISVSEGVAIGTYTQTVSVTDTNGVSAARSVTIQVVADSSETDTAISFNGSSQFFQTTGTVGLWGDQTWEAWVRPATVCSQASNSSVFGSENFVVFCNSSSWWLSYKDSGGNWRGYQTSERVVKDEWIHLAVVRSGTNFSFYANNRQAKIWVTSSWVDSYSQSVFETFVTIWMGGTGGAGQYFNGQIDEFKIWSEARTLSQIWNGAHTAENISSTGLLMYWDFNEGTGSALSRGQRADNNFSVTPISSQWTPVATPSTVGPYTVITVPRTLINKIGGWSAPDSITALTALVLGGGGGGGGGYQGGGGGAGGFRESTVTLDPNVVYPIRVGVGGQGATNPVAPSSGDTSTAFGLSAAGGGAGMAEFTVNTLNVQYDARSGASGGGGSHGTNRNGGSGISGQGNAGALGRDIQPTCNEFAGGGGGGAGSAGFEAICNDPAVSNTSHAGFGGSPKISVVTGKFVAGGGGGSLRGGNGVALKRGQGGNGDSTTAGNGGFTAGALVGATGGATDAPVGSGGGGGAGSSTDGSTGFGGNGGSGTVTFRYITASKPTYTAPTNAFLNVGMTETFTTNVAQDSATAMLTRTFRWESTTAGSGGTYSVIKQGTGAANAFFSWVPSDTSTSGNQYLFRVIVTDSDTAGLFIVDTSTAVFATINQTLRLTGKSTITKTVGVSKTETFTVTQGTPTYRYTFTNNNTLITLDTSTVGSPRIRLADTITVGTYSETLTLIDSVSATIVQPLTIVVNAPPSFSANAEQVDSRTILNLDAGNQVSYPRTGTTWNDISGRAISASLAPTGLPAQFNSGPSSCASPQFNTANLGNFTFNATNKTCAYVSNLGFAPIYTAQVWVRRDGVQNDYSGIISTPWPGWGNHMAISLHWISGGSVQAGVYKNDGWGTFTTAVPVANLTWTFVTVTFDGTTVNLMVDNNVASKNPGTPNALALSSSVTSPGLFIGKRFDGNSDYFNGSIASIRIYSRVLTDAEILQNYNATVGRFTGTQNKQSVAGKYGTTVNETYTVTAGSETITATFTSSAVAGLRWDTSTVRSMRVQLQDSLTAGTYNDTITVTDIYGSSTRISLTITVAKADTITVTMDTATVTTFNDAPISVYPKPTIRGLVNSDTATVTTKFSSANYTLSATPPTNADTYTVTATDLLMQVGSLDNYLGWRVETSTARINKARQAPLIVSTYTGFIGSSFTITVLGGSGGGSISETFTGLSTAQNCQINNRVLTSSATTSSYCQLQITKGESQNYLAETTTALIYFIEFVFNQPAPSAGSGPNVALTGENDVSVDVDLAPMISSLSTYAATAGVTSIQINGVGFNGSDPLFEIKFWRGVAGTGFTINPAKTQISLTVPAGARTGKVTVVTSKGLAVSEFALVVTP